MNKRNRIYLRHAEMFANTVPRTIPKVKVLVHNHVVPLVSRAMAKNRKT